MRGFARHLQAIGDCCEVPPPELLAFPKGRAQPYLYSQAEIASLMNAARALVPELRAATYETVIGLLATTGVFSRGANLDKGCVFLVSPGQ